MRTDILELLRTAGDGYVSGEEIAARLGVSRTAVWKHIQELREAGYDIESRSRNGYHLRETPDLLLPAEIERQLTTEVVGRHIVYSDETQSTNEDAKKLAAAGAADGTVVVTEFQGDGHGRLARGWFSPRHKGVLLSVILRPQYALPQEAPQFTLLAAVAVVEAMRACGVTAGIKWPNDILIDGKKTTGILTEMSAAMECINYIVIGIGVNVNTTAEEFPSEVRDKATSLQLATGQPVNRVHFAATLLNELERLLKQVRTAGFAPILDVWRRDSVTLGQPVRVIGMNEAVDATFTGTAVDIDDYGALLVDTPTGRRRVLAGDVSIRPHEAAAK